MNRLRLGLVLTAALAAAPGIAFAQDAVVTNNNEGWYATLGGGLNMLTNSDIKGGAYESTGKFHDGFTGLGAVGYSFGHFELEGELAARRNGVKDLTNPGGGTGHVWAESLMVNAIYDFLPDRALSPYIGVGAGAAHVNYSDVGGSSGALINDSDNVFAYQGIVGLRYNISSQWTADIDYRYFATANPDFNTNGNTVPATNSVRGQYRSNNFLVGLTYHFGAPPPAMPVAAPEPPPPPPPPPPPMAEAPKPIPQVYLVFFAFNRSEISPVAAQVLDHAIGDFQRTGSVAFDVKGYTDLAGTEKYNLKLSERRADAVKAYLLAHGVAASQIKTEWFGEADPRVPTAPGVRNQENRRAEIVLTK